MSSNYNKKQDIRLYRYFNFAEFLFPFLGIVLMFSVPFAHLQEIFLLQVNILMNKAWWFLGQHSLEYTLSWTWIKKLLAIMNITCYRPFRANRLYFADENHVFATQLSLLWGVGLNRKKDSGRNSKLWRETKWGSNS